MRAFLRFKNSLSLAFVAFFATTSLVSSEIADFTAFDVNLTLALLRKDQKIEVVVRDQVTDGCWTKSNAAKTAVEKNLIIAGYENIVPADDNAFFTIEVSALGYDTGGNNCAVYVSLRAISGEADRYYMNDHEVMAINLREQFSSSTLLTGPKSDMTSRINDTLYEKSDELIVAINAARNSLRKKISDTTISEQKKNGLLSAFSLD
ncbi:hypothetical protein [Ruegeria sp.]|uniref:hypothetical protein n=1 Tax=Ruegeria sp. TaxID=1879320 RepID=UPI003C7A5E92